MTESTSLPFYALRRAGLLCCLWLLAGCASAVQLGDRSYSSKDYRQASECYDQAFAEGERSPESEREAEGRFTHHSPRTREKTEKARHAVDSAGINIAPQRPVTPVRCLRSGA